MLVYTLIAAACLLVGFFVGRILTSRSYLVEQNRLKQELHDLEASFGAYRQEVAGHFVQSADLFNQLTHSYKAVVDHMAQGASQLVAEDVLQKRLGDSQREVVVLTPIGQVKRLAAQAGVNVVEHPTDIGEQITSEEAQHSTSAAEEMSHLEVQAGGTEDVNETEAGTVQANADQHMTQQATTEPDSGIDLDPLADEPIASAAEPEPDQAVAKAA